MTPFEIEILLYYYYSAEDNCPKKGSNLFKHTVNKFVNLGLILASPSQHPCCYTYSGNREALSVYIDALSAVPLPVKQWAIPNAS